MVSTVLIPLVAFIISRPTTTGAAATTTSVSKHHHQIHQTHKFHIQPHNIVRTILSNVQQQTAINDGDDSSLIDIDVSSTRLDDKAAVSLVEELLQQLENDDAVEEKKTRIKLAFAMNKITPLGTSLLLQKFNLSRGDNNTEEEEIEETTVNGTTKLGEEEEGNNDVKDLDTTTTLGEEEDGNNVDVEDLDATTQVEEPSILIDELDLSFNDIGGHGVHPPSTELLDSIRRLFESNDRSSLVPRVLVLENCGIGPVFCRSIGRGILESKTKTTSGKRRRPSALHLGGNGDIGDAGCVALAASLRMAIDDNSDEPVLEELDLSSCDIGDAGAEALALAISSNHGCILRLDLSHNKISDAGCKALGRAIVDARLCSSVTFDNIVLDNNPIGDEGASVLAEALGCGASKSISMRSCSIQAQGMALFGSAITALANRKDCSSDPFHVDLSGNSFGLKKIKKKKSKYSAGNIKNKATTNIKFVGKTLMGAAKRFSSESMGISADSDDDEEIMGGLIDDIDEENEIDDDRKLKSCGAQAFTGEILRANQPSAMEKGNRQISIGMRQCCLDEAAIDALSASIVGSKAIHLSVDVSMNGFDEDIVDALALDDESDGELLSSMAEEHMEYMDRLADARQRQLEATEESDIGFGFSEDEFDGYDEEYDDEYDHYDF